MCTLGGCLTTHPKMNVVQGTAAGGVQPLLLSSTFWSHGDLETGAVSVPASLEYRVAGPLSTSLLQEGLAHWYGKRALVAPWGKTMHIAMPPA